MIQDVMSAKSIICDLKEIAKKAKLDQCENYRIYDIRTYVLAHEQTTFILRMFMNFWGLFCSWRETGDSMVQILQTLRRQHMDSAPVPTKQSPCSY